MVRLWKDLKSWPRESVGVGRMRWHPGTQQSSLPRPFPLLRQTPLADLVKERP